MISHGKDVKVLCANANRPFAQGVCNALGMPMGNCTVTTFADGEVSVSINETVRGSDVFIVQSTCKPVNDNLMELLVMAVLPPSSPISAMPARIARPRVAIPSPPSWWPT